MSETLTIAIGVYLAAALVYTQRKHGDTLHPLVFLAPMLAYLYVVMPLELSAYGLLRNVTITDKQFEWAQSINLAAIVAMVLGIEVGIGSAVRRCPPSVSAAGVRPFDVDRVQVVALSMGFLALAAYAVTLHNVGGLYEAYSVVKGRGESSSGYVRDMAFWCVPSIGLLAWCHHATQRFKFTVLALIIAGPLLIHGLLGARRGPTFMILITLLVSYFLATNKRPKLAFLASSGAAIAILLLAILTFREQFRIGSDLWKNPMKASSIIMDEFGKRRLDQIHRTIGGNEFVYGTNVMLTFDRDKDFYYGKRLLTILFIRPIPRQIWPTKYEDIGMERYLVNVGLGHGSGMHMSTTLGAAPGGIADSFAEFSYCAVLAVWGLGWLYGVAYGMARRGTPLGFSLYTILLSLSVFFVMQTQEAFVFRLAFTALPVLIGLRWAAAPGKSPVRQTDNRRGALLH
ncbi:MAG: oligosaccharide repeat unit polymerase [Planctomycetales bacterium]|nr:oligosaccharide repeat unit polymerase [Planctomycetales bacterium]